MRRPVAIFTSDWHIWSTAPVYRSAEADWLTAMLRPIKEIKRFQKKNGNIPIFIAGDIFDYYNPPPAIINWLMKNLPSNCYAIPGQHDLQNHSLDLLNKTAFWTLVQAHVIRYLEPDTYHMVEHDGFIMQIYSKPWQVDVTAPHKYGQSDCLIYIAHQYIYAGQKTHYKGAPQSASIDKQSDFLQEVDVAVFGDNHIPFKYTLKSTQILNCGTLMRRKVDERSYPVGFFVLYDDLSIERQAFNTDKDVFAVIEQDTQTTTDKSVVQRLIDNLNDIDSDNIDFEEELNRELQRSRCPQPVKDICKQIFNEYKDSHK